MGYLSSIFVFNLLIISNKHISASTVQLFTYGKHQISHYKERLKEGKKVTDIFLWSTTNINSIPLDSGAFSCSISYSISSPVLLRMSILIFSEELNTKYP